jgi:hypothetical protein
LNLIYGLGFAKCVNMVTFFLKMEIAEKYGVYNVIPYTAYHIERQENYDPEHPNAVRFRYSPEGIYAGGSGYYGAPNTLGQ